MTVRTPAGVFISRVGTQRMRRFPAPWKVEAIDGGYKILDANGQSLAYVYGHADPRDAGVANALNLDEARRIAANIESD